MAGGGWRQAGSRRCAASERRRTRRRTSSGALLASLRRCGARCSRCGAAEQPPRGWGAYARKTRAGPRAPWPSLAAWWPLSGPQSNRSSARLRASGADPTGRPAARRRSAGSRRYRPALLDAGGAIARKRLKNAPGGWREAGQPLLLMCCPAPRRLSGGRARPLAIDAHTQHFIRAHTRSPLARRCQPSVGVRCLHHHSAARLRSSTRGEAEAGQEEAATTPGDATTLASV